LFTTSLTCGPHSSAWPFAAAPFLSTLQLSQKFVYDPGSLSLLSIVFPSERDEPAHHGIKQAHFTIVARMCLSTCALSLLD